MNQLIDTNGERITLTPEQYQQMKLWNKKGLDIWKDEEEEEDK